MIRIGTRASQLAVAQAVEVKNRILGAFPQLTQDQIELVKITTTGDKIQDRHLAEIGGKGLFTKEIEEALQADRIDLAVHSMKDMPDILPDGMEIFCVLEREDPRDAFLSPVAGGLEALPKGATVGTSSTRRQSQLLKIRPDLKIIPFRGNVNTRLRKLREGQVDATLLAVAGLRRLDMQEEITAILEPDVMLPAVCQGTIGIEIMSRNDHLKGVLTAINHERTAIRTRAERAFLHAMGGSCTTPMAGYAWYDEARTLHFAGLIAAPDGTEYFAASRQGTSEDAAAMGSEVGEELRSKGRHILETGWKS
ncbi:MAG: hydroxymethylbilane synthase [Hyphomicrobiales bacterium]|nr:hydroxymethylbilane synthase [Hyphomicrobiales bacterium]